MLLQIYIAVAGVLAPILAQDPRFRVVLIEQITEFLLTDDTPVTLTNEELTAIQEVKARLEAQG